MSSEPGDLVKECSKALKVLLYLFSLLTVKCMRKKGKEEIEREAGRPGFKNAQPSQAANNTKKWLPSKYQIQATARKIYEAEDMNVKKNL